MYAFYLLIGYVPNKRPDRKYVIGSGFVLARRWFHPFMRSYATLVGWGSVCDSRTPCARTSDVTSRGALLSVRQLRKTTTPQSGCQSKDI